MDVREIRFNTADDMLRFGWVLFEFSLQRREWVGYDEEGNEWVLQDAQIKDTPYAKTLCDERWYLCVKPADLTRARHIPRRPVYDSRNTT